MAFSSRAPNLVAGDTNNAVDVFVRDRQAGTTERVVKLGRNHAMSADARFIAFVSNASSHVAGDTNNVDDVFVRDRQTARTERVSVSSGGAQANGYSGGVQGCCSHDGAAAISADGRFVAFRSIASNLVPGDTNDAVDVFVHDRERGTTERVSVAADGAQANGYSWEPALAADGRFVAFSSGASNLVAGDTNGWSDVFVRGRGEGGGACTIEGSAGDDVLTGTPGDDVICGLGGADRISGGGGRDLLHGGDGDDRLSGGAGRDWLDGGPGDDHLSGGTGPDTFNGGLGIDRASYFARTGAVTVTIGGWQDDGGAGEGDDVRADVEQLAGGAGDDTLTGDHADNRLSGNAGNDRLTGGSGRDELVGGDGDDSLDGRDAGSDRLSCGAGLDTVLSDPVDRLSTTCENR